jgi:hypothetical protein
MRLDYLMVQINEPHFCPEFGGLLARPVEEARDDATEKVHRTVAHFIEIPTRRTGIELDANDTLGSSQECVAR